MQFTEFANVFTSLQQRQNNIKLSQKSTTNRERKTKDQHTIHNKKLKLDYI